MFLRVYTGVTTWWSDLKVRAEEEKGATAVEYALMVALIAVVIVAAVAFLGKAASNKFSQIGSGVKIGRASCRERGDVPASRGDRHAMAKGPGGRGTAARV